MRAFVLRAVVVGGLMATTAVVAQPPAGRLPPAQAKKLKDDLDALMKERDQLGKEATDTSEVVRLRKELLEKLKLLPDRLTPKPVEVLPPPKPLPPVKVEKPETKGEPEAFLPLDPLRAAQNYYRAGDVEAAFRAVRMVKPDTLSPDDRTFAHYLTACCLRRQGKLTEATALYREIAEEKQDPFLTESALSQLATIRNLQELESQLEQFRAKRKSK